MAIPIEPTAGFYALPSGTIVRLYGHCKSPVERYQIADGSFVVAYRVDPSREDGSAAAIEQAKNEEARRVALGIQGR